MTQHIMRLWKVLQKVAAAGYPAAATLYYLMRITETVLQHLQ
ncbi:hypothetical protein [Kitasatospora sp. NPDC057198]